MFILKSLFVTFNNVLNQIKINGPKEVLRVFLVALTKIRNLILALCIYVYLRIFYFKSIRISYSQLILKINLLIDGLKQDTKEGLDIFEEGLYYQSIDDLNNAMKKYQELKDRFPEIPESYFSIANIDYLQGNYKSYYKNMFQGAQIKKSNSILNRTEKINHSYLGIDWTSAIGHISLLDPYLKLLRLGLLGDSQKIIVTSKLNIGNRHYLDYYKDYIDVIALDDIKYKAFYYSQKDLFENLSVWELKAGFTNFYEAWSLAESQYYKNYESPLLGLSQDDEDFGYNTLKKIGLNEDSFFVCLHVREGESRNSRSAPDSDIITYQMGIDEILSRGGYVIRMGHKGMKKLPTNDRIIDYPYSEFKSSRMDVFLWAKCKFFIGTSSGPLSVPNTFGVPTLYTNAVNLGMGMPLSKSLQIPKLWKKRNHLMSLDEILKSPIGWTVNRNIKEYDLVDNSAEDIRDAVIDMFKLMERNFNYNLTQNQQIFNEIKHANFATGNMNISPSFAEKNSFLMK